jgi:hypothetical protein
MGSVQPERLRPSSVSDASQDLLHRYEQSDSMNATQLDR